MRGDGENQDDEEMKTPASKKMKTMRRSSFSSAPSMSPPSSMSKVESDPSTKRRQLGIRRFFSPGSGSDDGAVVATDEDMGYTEPPMSKRPTVKDTIRNLVRSGELEGVSLDEEAIGDIANKALQNRGDHGKKGGRPETRTQHGKPIKRLGGTSQMS